LYTYKTLIRDKLVDNATIKTLFAAAATGSCRVNMENLVASAGYPQVIMSYGGGETTPNMDADEVNIFLTVETRGSGAIHAHKEIGKFRSAILSIIDDTSLQSTTAVCYHFRKFSEVEGFDEDKKVWWLRAGFNGEFLQNSTWP